MKTSMVGSTGRARFAEAWMGVLTKGVADADGCPLAPGDLVALPSTLTVSRGGVDAVAGLVLGYAVGKDLSPCVVCQAPLARRGRFDRWLTWIAPGSNLHVRDAEEAVRYGEASHDATLARMTRDIHAISKDALMLTHTWTLMLARGVRTADGTDVSVGDLVRLPANVARLRGSQLKAAGLCMGYAVGADGSPCVVVDASGEDRPGITRWRTWLTHADEVTIVDTAEAWRLEGLYDREGRLLPHGRRRRKA